ncbi:sigma factor-like helix-turn-helix DNA-binding protein [Clostridium botulinum]|uniref:sigma-70 region 4 domain-containing protein n=1 Tax=Clostridium botulinum TaxID=1491 RepID=UPI001FA8808F|nr:sigma-70 region 4 domain-containing protein [Clostridium botulinum]KAI3344654.1 sigma-70 region 4 domain-containing protein [Clostridium botulinum]
MYTFSELNCLISIEVKNILKVLNELKEIYKSLLIFKYEMNLSYKEISLFLGMDENMVKTYLYRARNKFKEEWRLFNEKSRR